MSEKFEDGVKIAEVVTNVDDVNKEALDHVKEMGKGDED